MKLLLVEDSHVSQEVFQHALESFHDSQQPTIVIAGTLAEARQSVDACDVLVLDLTLPDADPDDMMDFARRWVSRKPVIIISGTSEDRHIIEAGEMGAGFLRKECVGCAVADALRVELLRAKGALNAKRAKQAMVHDFIRVLGVHT